MSKKNKAAFIGINISSTIQTLQDVDSSLRELWVVDKLLTHYGFTQNKTLCMAVCEALDELKQYREARESGEPFYGDNEKSRELVSKLVIEAGKL